MNAFAERIATREPSRQIFRKGLDDIDLYCKASVSDLQREPLRTLEQFGGSRDQFLDHAAEGQWRFR
jgi:hypothetical protein